jgi:hypothetical protein
MWLSAPERIKNIVDPSSVEGAVDLPYSIPNILVDYHLVEFGVVGPWRSVGNTQNAFFVECFIDELAAVSSKDSFEFPRRLLTKSPRHLAVLELAAENAGWRTPLPTGRFRGIAVGGTYDTFVSQVAEISVDRKSGALRVHRVVCAVDCGQYANPAGIEAQIEGGIAFGLTSLADAITKWNGDELYKATSTTTKCCESMRCLLSRSISCRAKNPLCASVSRGFPHPSRSLQRGLCGYRQTDSPSTIRAEDLN